MPKKTPNDLIQIRIDTGPYEGVVCEYQSIKLGFEEYESQLEAIPVSFEYELFGGYKKSPELEKVLCDVIIDILSGAVAYIDENRKNDTQQSDI